MLLAGAKGFNKVIDPDEEPTIATWRRIDVRRHMSIFDAVGVPGMIDKAMRDAPRQAEIMVVGVCMKPDRVQPFNGISKELTVRFALGYDPMEIASTLHETAEGHIDVTPMNTVTFTINAVPDPFDNLA